MGRRRRGARIQALWGLRALTPLRQQHLTARSNGRNVIDDTPAGLKRAISGDGIEVVAQGRVPPVTDRASALAEVARTLQDAGIGVQDIGLRRPPSTRSSCT